MEEWFDFYSLGKKPEEYDFYVDEVTGKNKTQRLVTHYRFVGCIDLPSIVPKHT